MDHLGVLTGWLEGSPYSLPDDVAGLGLLEEMMPRAESLEQRCQVVRDSIAAQFSEKLYRATRVNEIYESNAIEGGTASLPETFQIMQNHDMWDADTAIVRYTLTKALGEESKVRDVVGLAAARLLVDMYTQDRSRPITESDLRDMHGLIMRGDWSAGRYKQHINKIEGSDHNPMPPSDVPDAMHHMVSWVGISESPLLWKAAVAHAWLTHIHPFDDGNGRMARLLANYILGFGCYPPLIVKSTSDRPRYIDALAHSDSAGDIVPLVRIFVRVLNRNLADMEKPDFALELFQQDLKAREDSLHVRWQRTANLFLETVSGHLGLSKKSLRVFGHLSASDFERVQRRDKSGNAWFASATSPRLDRDLLMWVGYPTTLIGRQLEKDQAFPSFFLSERDPNPHAIKPYLPNVRQKEPQHDELCLIADENLVALRRGPKTITVKLSEGAELWAAIVNNYLDDMSTDDDVSGQLGMTPS
jgi:Fic family protein